MLYNSFDFLIFFPIVCMIYYIIPFRFRHIFLLFSSYYFYMCWNPQYALLLLATTVITYFSGIFIGYADEIQEEKKRNFWKKFFVAVPFVLNLSILFFFKYFNFAVASINRALSYANVAPVAATFDIILPVGISFFTFQALGYTVDVYRGDISREKNFLKYALFVSFFPQLLAGPIERSKNLFKQINAIPKFEIKNIQVGLTKMLWGYFQKVVISDNVAILVNTVYDNHTEYGSIELILATVFFAIQIYCDFGGYSNIAVGAAKVMGFDLMENFNTPYMANSVADFWHRWHISLSTWFRDYLYIPLGGNRKGRLRKYFNIMVVFLTSGLWHGASWHYVVWGGINGLYQVIGDILRPVRNKICEVLQIDRKAFSHQLAKGIVTFILVDISWIFFKANGLRQALSIINRICTQWNPWVLFNNELFELGLNSQRLHMLLAAILVLIAADICNYLKIDLIKGLCKQGIWLQYSVYLMFIFWVLVFGSYGPGYDASQFIYFQF